MLNKLKINLIDNKIMIIMKNGYFQNFKKYKLKK